MLTVPFPVTIALAGVARGKGAGRAAVTNGRARVYTDAKTRNYEAQLRYAAQQAMAGMPPTAQAVAVTVVVGVAVPMSFSKKRREAALAGQLRPCTRPDVENYSKAMDALNGIVWCDDKQIVDEYIHKRYAAAPGLTVTVALVETATAAGTATVRRPRAVA